uniref:uncharacterized protein LOC101967715 isoform X4 n=1 Tax=Ictidomys tridecemlineatus TaxID=43179 RepID=UPI001A9D322F|nr:uncharacterized protein LOC101967715 isoform X4 [Ictidomys tridecemlineatus]
METAMQLKPRHRPFCCSVKGHVKMLRLVPKLNGHLGSTLFRGNKDNMHRGALGKDVVKLQTSGYYQLDSNNIIHGHRICFGTDTRNHNMDNLWRGRKTW